MSSLQVLRNRIRLLCLLLPVLQALQCGAAGVTVIKRHPYTWAHEVGKFVAFVCVVSLIVAICTLLVIMPLHAASSALRMVAKVRPPRPAESATAMARTHQRPRRMSRVHRRRCWHTAPHPLHRECPLARFHVC